MQKLPRWTLFLAVCAVGIGGTFQYGYNVSIINAPTGHIHKFLNETWSSCYQMKLNPSLLTLLWSVIASIFSLGSLCGAHIGGSIAIRLGRLYNINILPQNTILTTMDITSLYTNIPHKDTELPALNIYKTMDKSSELHPKYIHFIAHFGGMVRHMEICNFFLLALKRFHGPLHYQEEMEDIQRERFALNGEKPKKPWQLFGDRSVKWQLITVIVMTMGQQLSGINAIYFYASYIFKQAGIPAEKIPYVTLGTGACECITALTCGLLIDYMGKRLLIIGGYTLMSFWCIVLTFSLTYQELYPWVPYLSMASIFAFILSFGLGPGGITNTLTDELFTQSSWPAAYLIGGSVSRLSFFTIGMLFPFIVNGLKQYCFVVFLLESLLVASFIFFVIPETKNKSFLEIKREFQHLNFRGRIKEKETELCERRQLCNEF
ncbi:solute carrier family 2, facilitated glucose transporter member 11-like [Pangshura tecta]